MSNNLQRNEGRKPGYSPTQSYVSDGCSCPRWPPLSTGQGQFSGSFHHSWILCISGLEERNMPITCLLIFAPVLLLCQDISHMISLLQGEWYILAVLISAGSCIIGGQNKINRAPSVIHTKCYTTRIYITLGQ